MRNVMIAVVMFAFAAACLQFTSTARAEDKGVTLKGKATCAKCDLKKTEKCQAALVVTEDGKDVVYYVKGDGAKDLHKEVCQQSKDGVSITGTVSEVDGQKWITASKIDG